MWSWHALSGNEALPWSLKLVEKHADKWDWNRISQNQAIPWSEALIDRYKNKWDLEALLHNEAVVALFSHWSKHEIDLALDKVGCIEEKSNVGNSWFFDQETDLEPLGDLDDEIP
jgi:hypothetical protein